MELCYAVVLMAERGFQTVVLMEVCFFKVKSKNLKTFTYSGLSVP